MMDSENNNIVNNEENPKKKKVSVSAIIIAILALIIIGMGVYILLSDNSSTNNNVDKKDVNSDVKKNVKQEEKEGGTLKEDVVKPLDITKSLNTTGITYSNPQGGMDTLGLSMKVNDDKKSVTLSIDWNVFGQHSGATAWAPEVVDYQITNFSKNVVSTFIGGVGQDVKGTVLFYLMEDGTVGYTPLFNLKTDSQNNTYYEMNYTYVKDAEGKVTNTTFEVTGVLENVNNVIKLYNVSASNGMTGYSTTIGATKDGSFYDLGSILQK